MRSWTLASAAAFALAGGMAGAAERRAVAVGDLARIHNVAAPDLDTSGTWVAYAV